MVQPKHVDVRGEFQELVRASEIGFTPKQVSICTINPGQTRGGHYHKETLEGFVVIEGEMILSQKNANDLDDLSVVATTMNRDINQECHNMPYEWHQVYSEKGCKFLVLLDREFNPENPDTYTL
jgi:UDP-2-acetamido-2,6-beta-L-arabino-hexul-4-ose reductase